MSSRSGRDGPRDLVAALHDLYAQVDTLLAGTSCDASTECCRFGVTGREPYVTKLELEALQRALRARGGLPRRRALPLLGHAEDTDARRCPLLGAEGRCLVYAARPFGCRTFFCARARGPGGGPTKAPRAEIGALLRALGELAERFDPRDGRGAPLTKFAALREPLERPRRTR